MEILAEKRMNICKKCPLYSIRYGGTCNNKLWMDPKTEDVTDSYRSGYILGCGCILESKVKGEVGTCPAEKW